MREQKAKPQIKKNLLNNTVPLSHHPNPDLNQPPPNLCHPPILYNNNTMDTEFVAEMRLMWKCNKWWIIHLTLEILCGPLSQDPLPPARNQSHLLIPSTQKINQKKPKEPRNEIQLSKNGIVLPWPMFTKPRAKRGRLGTQPSEG